MKPLNFKLELVFILFITTFQGIAQCIKPEPMTAEQIQMVVGTWKGSYKSSGKEIPITIVVTENKNNQIACTIDKPPVMGKIDLELFYFCGSGEFHIQKILGTKTYSFQGVPLNNSIKGYLTVKDGDNTLQRDQFIIRKM